MVNKNAQSLKAQYLSLLFIIWRLTMLYQSATNFKRLTESQFVFHVSKKNKTRRIIINFNDENYYHLVGIQKLTDINKNYTTNKSKFLSQLMSGDIAPAKIKKSKYYFQINGRIELCCYLHSILYNSDLEIYEYNPKAISWQNSRVKFDYVLKFKYRKSKHICF